MKFHVWCPDRGEDESCACAVEAPASREAAALAAERDYWNAADPFDAIELDVRAAPEEPVLQRDIAHFVVQVEAVPTFTARFLGREPQRE